MSANEPEKANEIWMKRIEFRNLDFLPAQRPALLRGQLLRGRVTASASGGFAELVESDEQSGAKGGDNEQIHFVEQGHVSGKARL